MSNFFNASFLLAAVAVISLASCQKNSSVTPTTTLEGTWQLTNRQCYCVATPLPSEAVVFTAGSFTILKNNRLSSSGSYLRTVAPFCGGTPIPALELRPTTGNPRSAQLTVSGDTLTLDYGGPCDAPRDTYVRQRQP